MPFISCACIFLFPVALCPGCASATCAGCAVLWGGLIRADGTMRYVCSCSTELLVPADVVSLVLGKYKNY